MKNTIAVSFEKVIDKKAKIKINEDIRRIEPLLKEVSR